MAFSFIIQAEVPEEGIGVERCFMGEKCLSWRNSCEWLLKAVSQFVSIIHNWWKWKEMAAANTWVLWRLMLYTSGQFTESLKHSQTACFLKVGNECFSLCNGLLCSWLFLFSFLNVAYYSSENITDADFIPRPLSQFRYVTLIKAHVYWRGLLNLL